MDLHKKQLEHYKKAINLSETGRNPFGQLKLSAKLSLLDYKKWKTKKVKIIGVGGCASCKRLVGKAYSVDEAIKKMPLPNKRCSYHLYPENRKYGFCRCTYVTNIPQ